MNKKFILFIIQKILMISSLLLLIKSANSQENIKSLIGSNIPAHGSIENFTSIGSGLIHNFSQDKGYALGSEEGIYNNKWPALIIMRIYKDSSSEITDAIILPKYEMEYIASKRKINYNKNGYRLSSSCQLENYDSHITEETIYALVRPEKGKSDCGHFSKNVSHIWIINSQGKASIVPSKGARCFYLTLHDCY